MSDEKPEAKPKQDGEIAVTLVRAFSAHLIQLVTKGGSLDDQDGHRVSVQTAIEVLNWIIEQTNKFSTAVRIRFLGHDSSIIGMCLCLALHGKLEDHLSSINAKGIKMPCFDDMYLNGVPTLCFSDLSQMYGMSANDCHGVTIINICDTLPPTERVVLLKDIPKFQPVS